MFSYGEPSRAGFTGTYARTCTHRMTVLWSDSRAEFTPVYNGVVRALLTPDDYNQQPFRETTPPGRVYSLFYFPFERCEPPRDRNHGAVCGYLRNCLTNITGKGGGGCAHVIFAFLFFARDRTD